MGFGVPMVRRLYGVWCVSGKVTVWVWCVSGKVTVWGLVYQW